MYFRHRKWYGISFFSNEKCPTIRKACHVDHLLISIGCLQQLRDNFSWFFCLSILSNVSSSWLTWILLSKISKRFCNGSMTIRVRKLSPPCAVEQIELKNSIKLSTKSNLPNHKEEKKWWKRGNWSSKNPINLIIFFFFVILALLFSFFLCCFAHCWIWFLEVCFFHLLHKQLRLLFQCTIECATFVANNFTLFIVNVVNNFPRDISFIEREIKFRCFCLRFVCRKRKRSFFRISFVWMKKKWQTKMTTLGTSKLKTEKSRYDSR